MWLIALFILVPMIEIALFIEVGGWIGLWPTLAVVVLTAILGTRLMRRQGALELSRLRHSLSELRDPTEPLAHGGLILLAGMFLLTPGFFTDAMGLGLLIPPVRAAVFRWLKTRVRVQSFAMGPDMGPGPGPARPDARPQDRVIETDYKDVTPGKRPTHPSGWSRH